ncbi:hypothetical protein ACXU4B_08055 [Dyella soli]|uniref:Phytochrome chromophore attachment site domain-containing protein n=1 Tax=Dyella soli TaxID=522319 RepID=A0A4R0YPZ5_9GAMM|nr:hypothetical protein [Dyella soli]TCI10916.1 hypothetical protein EZM97_18950 [Dyella soli]
MKQSSIEEIEIWRRDVRSTTPTNPALYGWNSFSQCDEDGIIRECLRRIADVADLSKTFIEVGCANGLENNTHQLLLDGYRGCWVDGDDAHIRHIEEELGTLNNSCLLARHAFINLDNSQALVEEFREFLGTEDIDFFSFDTDGNDAYLVEDALKTIKPKLICVEYNGKFPPPTRLVMKYNPKHQWAFDDYYGATLQSWVDILEPHGYRLVSCNLSGVNAFFVRNDVAGGFDHYSTQQLFQPCRYWLIGITGHPHTLKWLRQIVNDGQASPR